MDDDFSQLVFELGLDYEMQNSMLQAAAKGSINPADFLETFNASGEIWKDPIDLGDLEGEASKLDSIFVSRMSFSSLPQVASSNSLSSVPHIQIPQTESPTPNSTPLEPPHETNSFRQDSAMKKSLNSALGTSLSSRTSSSDGLSAPLNRRDVSFPLLATPSYPSLTQMLQGDEEKEETSDSQAKIGTKRKAEPVKNGKQAAAPAEKKKKIFVVAGDSPNDDSEEDEEKKRFAHVSAEQKRRDNLKSAFTDLKLLLPQYKDKGNVSKSLLLKTAIEHIIQLSENKDEIQQLRKENEELRKALGMPAPKKKGQKEGKIPATAKIPPTFAASLTSPAPSRSPSVPTDTYTKRIPSEPKLHHYFD